MKVTSRIFLHLALLMMQYFIACGSKYLWSLCLAVIWFHNSVCFLHYFFFPPLSLWPFFSQPKITLFLCRLLSQCVRVVSVWSSGSKHMQLDINLKKQRLNCGLISKHMCVWLKSVATQNVLLG